MKRRAGRRRCILQTVVMSTSRYDSECYVIPSTSISMCISEYKKRKEKKRESRKMREKQEGKKKCEWRYER